MIDNLLKTVHAFTRCILTSFSVDETLLPGYMVLSTNFRETSLRVKMAPSHLKKHELQFVCVNMEAESISPKMNVIVQLEFELA